MIHRPLVRRATAIAVAGAVAVTVAPATAPPVSGTTVRGGSTLLVVGDSLTVGASILGKFSGGQRSVKKAWSKVVVDAKVGRTARQGVSTVRSQVKKHRAGAVVVALGTNDMMSRRDSAYVRAQIDAVMAAAGDRPVLWVNLEFATLPARERPARARMFNKELTRAVTRWPNLHIADWNSSFAPTGRSRFLADGVHLTTSGYRTRASFYAREVVAFREWIDAVLTTTTTTLTIVPSTTTTLPGDSTTTTSTSIAASTTTSTTPGP